MVCCVLSVRLISQTPKTPHDFTNPMWIFLHAFNITKSFNKMEVFRPLLDLQEVQGGQPPAVTPISPANSLLGWGVKEPCPKSKRALPTPLGIYS